jgi:hypothetical protein
VGGEFLSALEEDLQKDQKQTQYIFVIL